MKAVGIRWVSLVVASMVVSDVAFGQVGASKTPRDVNNVSGMTIPFGWMCLLYDLPPRCPEDWKRPVRTSITISETTLRP